MSDRAFRSATKNRREHRERSQPSHRSKKLGPLEKKKDYKIRARKTHLRDDTIRLLKEKAALKNPDEFYYAMTSGKRLPVPFSKPKICGTVLTLLGWNSR